ncbi:MAG: PAS domain-containing protein, partial [Gammaproteobacteria bacterium]
MPSQPTPLRVLMIEDDRIEAELIRRQLAQSAFTAAEIEHHQRIAPALARLAEVSFDIVLLDLNLPDGHGVDNLIRVTGVRDSVPVIILTNVEDERTATALVSEGAQDYLIKRHITADLLARAMRYAIARNGAEVRLRESEKRFALAVAGARDGIWDWDLERDYVYYSPRWLDMLGLTPEQVTPAPASWLDRVEAEDQTALRKALQSHLDGDTAHFEAECRMTNGHGKQLWVLARGLAVRDAHGRAVRIAGSLSDISDRKSTEAMLVHEALHDALTGLPNRNLFLDRLDLAMRQHRRDRTRKFAVLFLDLDTSSRSMTASVM